MRALVSRGDIRLIRYLSAQRPSMPSELSEATGLRRATVSRQLSLLSDLGLVRWERRGGGRRVVGAWGGRGAPATDSGAGMACLANSFGSFAATPTFGCSEMPHLTLRLSGSGTETSFSSAPIHCKSASSRVPSPLFPDSGWTCLWRAGGTTSSPPAPG